MPPRAKKIRMDDDLIGAGRDAGVESLFDGRLGQFHMCVADNLKIRHLLHHSGDFGEQLVRILPGAAMIY